jgi:BirA family biotin operon repressor/biotin-[acetyl-CoA-carboxylase] ligase
MKQVEFEQAIAGLTFEKAAFFDSIGSTNDVIAEWASKGTTRISIAAADEQTSGRGRSGRRWFTPPGSALAFSLLLDLAPSFDKALLGRASGLGALAVSEALERHGLQPLIKWPNDVLLSGKKVAGILPEAHWSGERLQALILGVGVNISSGSVPPANEVSFPATSVEESSGKKIMPGDLLRAMLESLAAWKERMSEPEFMDAWQAKLAYLGKQVQLENADGPAVQAIVEGLAEDGGLKMRMAGGELRTFQAGEIQLRTLLTEK